MTTRSSVCAGADLCGGFTESSLRPEGHLPCHTLAHQFAGLQLPSLHARVSQGSDVTSAGSPPAHGLNSVSGLVTTTFDDVRRVLLSRNYGHAANQDTAGHRCGSRCRLKEW